MQQIIIIIKIEHCPTQQLLNQNSQELQPYSLVYKIKYIHLCIEEGLFESLRKGLTSPSQKTGYCVSVWLNYWI